MLRTIVLFLLGCGIGWLTVNFSSPNFVLPWEAKPSDYVGQGHSGPASIPIVEKPVYGAIAYSEETSAWGSSIDYSDLDAAKRNAVQRCEKSGAKDCAIVLWNKETCMALAVSPRIKNKQSGGWGTGVDENIDAARSEALTNCKKFAKSCKIVESFCSYSDVP